VLRKPSRKSTVDVGYIEEHLFQVESKEEEEREEPRRKSFFVFGDPTPDSLEPYQYEAGKRTSNIDKQMVKDKLNSELGGDLLYQL